MVYSSRFVLNVLINGQIVEARKDGVIAIPFGSEYVIRVRNKHKDRRALAKINVDGENISAGGFVIDADSHMDIKRRADVNSALKFMELTSDEAKETGKESNDDGGKGVIEVKFHLEKERRIRKNLRGRGKPPVVVPLPMPYPVPMPPPAQPSPYDEWGQWKIGTPVWRTTTTDNTRYDGHQTFCSAAPAAPEMIGSAEPMNLGVNVPLTSPDVGDVLERLKNLTPGDLKRAPATTDRKLEEGCTVDGGLTDQSFVDVHFDAEADFVTLMCVLRGYKPGPDDKVGVVSIGPKQDEYCTNCGQKKGRKADRFCGKCGHKL
jgi:hypothetical protein